MSITALANRSIRTIKLELEFLRDTDFIDPTTLSRIIALLPEPEAPNQNKTATTAPVVKATPEPAKKVWPPVAPISEAHTTIANAVTAAIKPPLPVRAKTENPTVSSSVPEKTPIPSLPPPDLPPPPSYSIENMYRAKWAYTPRGPTDLELAQNELLIIMVEDDDPWAYGRSRFTGREGWVPRNRIVPATEQDIGEWEEKQKKLPQPHDTNMMTNVAYGNGQNSGFSAPQPPQEQQQDEGKGKSKLQEHGKKFGSKLGNAAIFGAGATIGSNIINGIF